MFDTPAELLAKIRLGEDSQLELKAVTVTSKGLLNPHPDSLAQEIAAFANSTHGGVMVLGVDDRTKEITGLNPVECATVEQALRGILNDRIDPPVVAMVRFQNLSDPAGNERTVVRVDVPRSLFVHRAPGGYFQRIGSAKREMSAEWLQRIMQHRSQSRLVLFDETPVMRTDIGTLDKDLAGRFIEGSEENPESLYQKMGILTTDLEGKTVCSVAGVLIATRRPDQVLHGGACIEAVHYAGKERDADMQVTARRITGPIDRQILDAFDFVRGAMLRPATKEPARIERPAFSEKAVFEGIVNAVVHRDYSVSGSKIRVFVFSDRLEIYSPGALPNTLTVDTLRFRQFTRNETLVSLLGRLRFEIDVPDAPIRRGRFMESRGEGVPIIFRETISLGAPPPVYEMFDDSELRLTIFAQP
jgi:predicted HTH transcriptional regulator